MKTLIDINRRLKLLRKRIKRLEKCKANMNCAVEHFTVEYFEVLQADAKEKGNKIFSASRIAGKILDVIAEEDLTLEEIKDMVEKRLIEL